MQMILPTLLFYDIHIRILLKVYRQGDAAHELVSHALVVVPHVHLQDLAAGNLRSMGRFQRTCHVSLAVNIQIT